MAEKEPKKSQASARGADRHKKKGMQLRLHPILRGQLEKLVERNVSSLTEEITAALRKHLAEHGLWPPAGHGKCTG